jgi:nicotinic acid mononucleotide adenylyltransferase
MINDPWYKTLYKRYGMEYCDRAGYFEETKPWDDSVRYADHNVLPSDDYYWVFQFSGAFHPFHEGHLSVIMGALDAQAEIENAVVDGRFESFVAGGTVAIVIHVDHSEYRNSKGEYPEEKVVDALRLIKEAKWRGHSLNVFPVFEDAMPNGCSRNFTRLYAELRKNRPSYKTIFVSGGDRANYALAFRDSGACTIVGRENSEMYKLYSYLPWCSRHINFVGGDNPMSSTAIRKAHNG